jgi:hypothetical protein
VDRPTRNHQKGLKSHARKNYFSSSFHIDLPVQPSRGKYLYFFFPEFVITCGRPASTRGALRGRHGRGERDAMGAVGHSASARTNDLIAHGEVVWSWHPDADAKWATMLAHRADDGGQKARRTGEITYKP